MLPISLLFDRWICLAGKKLTNYLMKRNFKEDTCGRKTKTSKVLIQNHINFCQSIIVTKKNVFPFKFDYIFEINAIKHYIVYIHTWPFQSRIRSWVPFLKLLHFVHTKLSIAIDFEIQLASHTTAKHTIRSKLFFSKRFSLKN